MIRDAAFDVAENKDGALDRLADLLREPHPADPSFVGFLRNGLASRCRHGVDLTKVARHGLINLIYVGALAKVLELKTEGDFPALVHDAAEKAYLTPPAGPRHTFS